MAEDIKGSPAAVIVSAISAAIALQLGLTAGVLIPFIAIFIHGMAALGLNSACRLFDGSST